MTRRAARLMAHHLGVSRLAVHPFWIGLVCTGLVCMGLVCMAHAQNPSPAGIAQRLSPIFAGERTPTAVQLSEAEQLAIGWLHLTGSVAAQQCTVNLVADDIVLTARHCFDENLDNVLERSPLEVEISFGRSPSTAEVTLGVIEAELHPHADLALLRLSARVTDQLSITPLVMNTDVPGELLTNRLVEAAGHGLTEVADKVGLFFVSLPVTCVDDDYIEVTGDGLRGICGGDSGGPILATRPDGRVGIAAIEHQGDPSCVGRDYLVRLDRHEAWMASAMTRLQGGIGTDPCGGLQYRGRCVEGRVEWCQDETQIFFQDCAQRGEVCGFLNPQEGLFCRPETRCDAAPDQCSGGVLIRCVDGDVLETDCIAQGKVCASSGMRARCVARCGVAEGDAIDDGSGAFRRPGEPVEFKGVFGLGCATTHCAPTPWWLFAPALALLRRRR